MPPAFRSAALVLLPGLFIVLMLSCRSTATAVPATDTNPVAGSATGPQLPDAAALKRSAQDLFDRLDEAIATRDAAAVYAKMTREVTDRCTLEQFQRDFVDNQDSSSIPDFEVETVFLDLDDFDRAIAEVSNRALPDADRMAFPASAFPVHIVRESGEWRFSFARFLPEGDDCPFADDTDEDATPTPEPAPRPSEVSGFGADSPFVEFEPPPGDVSHGSSLGGNDGQFEAMLLLETDMSPAELREYYREQIVQPDWEIQGEQAVADAAWLNWTFRDNEGRLWVGMLMVSEAKEGVRVVRAWVATSSFIDFRSPFRNVEPSPPPPVPLPQN